MKISPALGAALAVAAPFLIATCRLDPEAFHKKLYSCNPSAADPACGTDIDDQPMSCVAAHQLGGRNFCATGCDQKAANPEGTAQAICLPSGPRNAGVVSGATLRKCDPSIGNVCNDDELSCLRTDLIKDEGVCMTINPCKTNKDCRDPVRSVCMGDLLREVYGEKAALKTDHTYCVQGGCRANKSACSPGETCLRDIIPPESRPSDICVPNCDSNQNCPPNYFCYGEMYPPLAKNICLPGLLGLRCRSRMDCLFGDCIPTGAGFNVCAAKCANENDCAKYDSEHGTFFCNPDGYCMSARAFTNTSACTENDQCLPGQACVQLPGRRTKLCFFPCGGDGSCTTYAGVPHGCHPTLKICLPGQLGTPCTAKEQCFPTLDCRNTLPVAAGVFVKTCTVLCKDDDDCGQNRFAKHGFCHPQLQVCLSPMAEGSICDRDTQCDSKLCTTVVGDMMNMMPVKRCERLPGY